MQEIFRIKSAFLNTPSQDLKFQLANIKLNSSKNLVEYFKKTINEFNNSFIGIVKCTHIDKHLEVHLIGSRLDTKKLISINKLTFTEGFATKN